MSRRKPEANGDAVTDHPLDRPTSPPGDPASEPSPDPPDERPNMPCFVARFSTVRACVWKNDTDQGVRYQTTISRIYLGQDNRWHSTASFGFRDLPLVEKVCAACFEWIARQYVDRDDVPF